jgi:hypothetical protein
MSWFEVIPMALRVVGVITNEPIPNHITVISKIDKIPLKRMALSRMPLKTLN